jgi:uncharacterized membrane protein YgcG
MSLRLGVLLCALLSVTGIRADERILDYRSEIAVQPDGVLRVTETLRVRAEGQQIRRGIYRDFPTRYTDRFGNRVVVDFTPLSVRRDGASEPWRAERHANGVRVYAGSANRLLEPGVHEYELVYTTNRQLGYFERHDELYFNAVGTGWAFPIDRVAVRVLLPFPVQPDEVETNAFLGAYGSSRPAASEWAFDGRALTLDHTSPLAPREGLTVSLRWPKGRIPEPGAAQRLLWFFGDNGGTLLLLAALQAVFGWYAWAWNRVGRDPRAGVIIPRYRPPDDLSPAACHYVRSMGFGREAFTAALVSLAVKGRIRIEEVERKEFALERLPEPENAAGLSRGERALLEKLLPTPGARIEMDNANHQAFQAARSALKKALKAEYLGKLFHLNGVYLVPALLVTVGAAIGAMFLYAGPVAWIAYAVLGVGLHLLFLYLMRAPTPAGRRIMDEIEGFRMYLGTAEQERLDRMRSPELTPDVFEAFLPYAYALGVENDWCDRFTREMPREQKQNGGYHPAWYSGQLHGLGAVHHLGSNFSSSFGSAIASASAPPGSSSGGGGGGFSGGGGGGGGGGGW